MGLLNVLEYSNSTTLPKTHNRGKQEMNNVWVAEDLMTSIISAGMIPFGSGFKSDPGPLFWTYKYQRFTQKKTYE